MCEGVTGDVDKVSGEGVTGEVAKESLVIWSLVVFVRGSLALE